MLATLSLFWCTVSSSAAGSMGWKKGASWEGGRKGPAKWRTVRKIGLGELVRSHLKVSCAANICEVLGVHCFVVEG